MKRFLGSVCYVLAAVVVVLGALTALQMRAPLWQKTLTIALVLLIGAALTGLGRRARQPAVR